MNIDYARVSTRLYEDNNAEEAFSWLNPKAIAHRISYSLASCGESSLGCVWNTGTITYDYGSSGLAHARRFALSSCRYMANSTKIFSDNAVGCCVYSAYGVSGVLRSPVTRSLTRRFVLGFSKPFALSGAAMGLHSYVAHGKRHEALTDEEMAEYLLTMLSVSIVMGVSEAALYFRPTLEVSLLPVYNALIQGLDSVTLKYLLIFDNDCREIYQPTCNNYDKLITVSEYALAPILVLAMFSAYSEYAKYNTVKNYLTNRQSNSVFVRSPRLQQALVAIDSGISLASLATTMLSFVNLYRLFFLEKNSFVAEDLQIYIKSSAFLMGGIGGGCIATKKPNQLKQVFCFNEFNQAFILNLAATSINFVIVYMLSVDHSERGIAVLSDNKRANIALLAFSASGSLFNAALRVHDEYSYKYPTQKQLDKVYTRYYRAAHGQELLAGRSTLFFSTEPNVSAPQSRLLPQREEDRTYQDGRARTLSDYLIFR